MLTDGRILVDEYKGAFLAEGVKEKRMIGKLWAEASCGQCLFRMPIGPNFSEFFQALQQEFGQRNLPEQIAAVRAWGKRFEVNSNIRLVKMLYC